jgi:hypothetical protein
MMGFWQWLTALECLRCHMPMSVRWSKFCDSCREELDKDVVR